ncbi:DUF2157 domain-containing protein [Leptospira ilyithenensis]|uniref:DUF2157 domain-containing protein n=1 Tax=Leptospira ilyithenensis TaxID=2484901 RepID=A0A4R9LPP0_9LEPT|nr:DUF2157 domain-containing protein [Leptospira ilyithenensis]TGN09424.1 DUF2157 domain-containing protein [Leptospira ilyithenensis]
MLLERKSTELPSLKDWSDFGKRFLLVFGALFFLAGVIFFFAFNWNGLHRYSKLSLVSIGLVAINITYTRNFEKLWIRELLGALAFFFVGQILLVFGQIYQTGANAYDLFFGWAVFSVLLVAVSGSPVVWFLWIFLLNLTFDLYWEQVLRFTPPVWAVYSASVLNLIALFIYEFRIRLKKNLLRSAWFSPLILVIALGWLNFGSNQSIFFLREDNQIALPYVLVTIFSLGGLYAFYRFFIYDLACLSFVLLSGLALVFSLYIKYLTGGDMVGNTFLGFFIIMGLTTGMVVHLLQIRKEHSGSESK